MNRRAFTLVEIAISALVLALLLGGCIFIYQRSNSAFSITLWKQERTAQAERFWTHFRKHIEEASDLLVIPDDEMGNAHPRLQKQKDMPILIHSYPGSIGENSKANLLAWNVSTLDINFETKTHSSKSETFCLEKDGRRVFLKGEKDKVIAELYDVVSVAFEVKPIVKTSDSPYESIGGSGAPVDDATVVGTLLEISITMAPPKLAIAEKTKIPQNHKFRLNVNSKTSDNPEY